MKRFRIGGEVYGPVEECSVDEDAVACTASWDNPYQADTYTGSFSGTLSGREITGTSSTRQTGHDASDPTCLWESQTSMALTYVLNSDGTVTAREGPGQWRMTRSGSCSGTESGSSSPADTGEGLTWTVIG